MVIENSPIKEADLLVTDDGERFRLLPMALTEEEWKSVWDTLDGYAYKEDTETQ
jgi:hypothetical protein